MYISYDYYVTVSVALQPGQESHISIEMCVKKHASLGMRVQETLYLWKHTPYDTGTNSAMNLLHFCRILWSTGPSITR